MHRLVRKIRSYYLRWKYRGAPVIVQTEFLGCQLLVRANEVVGQSILLNNFEIEDLRYLQSQVRDGDVIFDVGANTGAYSLALGKMRKNLRVHAFEPVPLNAQILRLVVVLNKAGNIKVIEKCVSKNSGEVTFSLSEDSAYSSMINTGRKAEIEVLKCEAISLDDYCSANQILRVDLVKVDVEGAEELVIAGAARLFSDASRKPRLVLIELYDQNLNAFSTSIEKINGVMRGHDYSPFVFEHSRLVGFEPRHFNKYYNVFFKLNGQA